MCLVDSGWSSDHVYAACARSGGRARPIKGEGGGRGAKPPWSLSFLSTDRQTGKRSDHGQRLVLADVDYWKAWLFSRLVIDPNADGAFLFHADVQEEYVQQLCCVVPVPRKDNKGRYRVEWQTIDDSPDHWPDAENYAAVAADILGWRHKPESSVKKRFSSAPKPVDDAERVMSDRKIDFK